MVYAKRLILKIFTFSLYKMDIFDELVTDTHTDCLAITGMACVFPKADTLEDYWMNLRDGKDCISEITRWDTTTSDVKYHGLINNLDYFDHRFFGLSYAEAQQMDPQQRMVLEQGYLAMHQAGYDKTKAKGQRIGVFVGICGNDLIKLQEKSTVFSATGVAHSVAANRFSFIFGLTGPSFAVDTACSSS